MTDKVALSRCPFCGSTHLDPASWMSDADTDNTGLGCMDCGATAESVEVWNKRYEPDAERFRKLVPAMLDQRSTTGEYLLAREPKDIEEARSLIDAAPAYVRSLAATPDEGVAP